MLSLLLEGVAFNWLLKRVGCIDSLLYVSATENEVHGSVEFPKIRLPTEAPSVLRVAVTHLIWPSATCRFVVSRR